MGKNHRHKKNLKADKGKVKLKQSKTKFLPKGLNETKATFKIKPIVLAEQLRERSSDLLLSRRKLNIKDLCSRIKHFNYNVRCAACEELTDMYKQFYEDIIREHLCEVIENVSNLMQDMERKVRTAAVKAINVILELTPSEKLEPFFEYFSVNMRCAMTNIDQSIQEDSLKFLDCFLVKDCGLISKTSNKFLPDFFTLISRLRTDNTLGRTLTLNLGSKMTSVTWRIKVLSRLNAVLDLILKKNEQKDEGIIDCSADSSNTFPIYKDSFFKVLDNPNLDGIENNVASENVFDTHLSTLLPVFYDIWMEVVPDKKVNRLQYENTYLNDEASAILWSVINTMYLLWKYIETTKSADSDLKNIFVSADATKFLNHLLANFPYCQSDRNLLTKTKMELKSNTLFLGVSGDPNCVRENIMICYMCFVLNVNFTRNTSKKELERVAVYVNKCLLTQKYVDQSNVQYVIEFIKLSLLENCHVWRKSKVNARELLENVLVFYNNAAIGEKNKMRLFKIFAGLLDNAFLSNSSQYHVWLSSLPELLCKPQISDLTVETLLELARKNCVPFLNAVKSNLSKILCNLNSLKIILTKKSYKDESIVKREIAFIFFYLKGLTGVEINTLMSFLINYISKQDCFILEEHLLSYHTNCLMMV
ncbi:unnamed protein product [Psylliodes chrysocephalus]|uniref:Pre-rRNA-processing protein Ipi1 N-terminal domain-containing protein n=1 Tax=Psylliodes chrysocephalus TaxID=3402493 RepID=A0A9P0CL56_9CUCU|nr:unnamed protein product [Psylliodes chrysocephala]